MIEYILGFIIIGIMAYGSFVACEETSERRRQWIEGTHDYYGNKLDD